MRAENPVVWQEDFDPIKTTWLDNGATWSDPNNFSGTLGKLTESDAVNFYGSTESETITLDMDVYSELVIRSVDVNSSSAYLVGIQEQGGAGIYQDMTTYIEQSGTQIVNIADMLGWTGQKSFRIVIWMSGESKSAVFDYIEIRRPQAIPAWQDNLDPVKYTWYEFGAYWDDINGPEAILTEDNLGVAYGKVESESLLVDLNEYPILAVRSTAIDTGAKYSIGLQGQASPWPYVSLVDYQPEPAEHAFNILEETDWTGQQFFRIVIWIDGEMKGATFDMIQLRQLCGRSVVPGDYSDDCYVDLYDLAVIASDWLGVYDADDLTEMAGNWLGAN